MLNADRVQERQRPAMGGCGKQKKATPGSIAIPPDRLAMERILALQRSVGNSAATTFILQRKKPQVKIGKPIGSTDIKAAKQKAREIAMLIKAGKWEPEGEEQLKGLFDFFEGKAQRAFRFELQEVLGSVEYEGAPRARTEAAGEVTKANLVTPTSEPKVVRGGFTVAYTAQIFEETSESTSVEIYSDLSGGVDFSVEIPIKKVAKLKLGVGYKKGRKESEKQETKAASRVGRTMSRAFKVQKVERQVFVTIDEKSYHGEGPIAKKVTYENRGYNPEDKQEGYQIVPAEGGETWGPFWNKFNPDAGGQDKQSALSQVWNVFEREHRQLAEDLVFGGR